MNLWRRSLPSERLADGAPWPPSIFTSLHDTQSPQGAFRSSRPWVHAALFALTLFSVTVAGAMQRGVNPLTSPSALVHLVEGLPFAATLLAILGIHEFGHYFAARYWGVRATLPYFLPLPYISFLGTLGAVIRLRSPIPHRRALLDIGAAGPLAGFVVAVFACVVGLQQSEVVGADYFYPGTPIQLGSPLLFRALASVLAPTTDSSQFVLLSPVAFAGWVGLFITAFNLLPVGQLDGGHIVYALFGRVHASIARITFAVLLAMGLYGIMSMIWELPHGWPGWLALAFFLTLFGKDHPAPMYQHIGLNRSRRIIGYLCLAIFAVCIAPVPFTYTAP